MISDTVENLSPSTHPSAVIVVWSWVKHTVACIVYTLSGRVVIFPQQDMVFGAPRSITKLDLSKRESYLVRTKDGDEFFGNAAE